LKFARRRSPFGAVCALPSLSQQLWPVDDHGDLRARDAGRKGVDHELLTVWEHV
jgi:hypothetical protein